MKILVTGSSGQLGSELTKICSNSSHEWIFTTSAELDFTELENIPIFLEKYMPDILINCAAYTNVEDAENEYQLANLINHESVKLISKWTKNKCKLIHISTDYVFDGNINTPIKETFSTNPLNAYGKTKLMGDEACLYYNPDSMIIRTSLLYSIYGNNFVKNIISNMKLFQEIKVVDNYICSPTYAYDLAYFIYRIIKNGNWHAGIFNFSNKGKVSRYGFSLNIKDLYGFDNVNIIPVDINVSNFRVKRPEYSVLDNEKIISTFKYEQIDYLKSLKKFIQVIKNEA